MISTEPRHLTAIEPEQSATTGVRPAASIVVPVHNRATVTRQFLGALLSEPDAVLPLLEGHWPAEKTSN